MKIGVETRVLSTPATGMGRFLANMLRELHDRDDADEYFLYSHRPFKLPFALKPSWHLRVHARAGGWNGSWWLLNTLPRAAADDGIDVFWGTGHVLPPLRGTRIRTVLTVHDFTYLACPETMRRYSRFVSARLVPRAVRAADGVVCVSEHIGNEARMHFPEAADKISVIPEGVDAGLFAPVSRTGARALLRESYGIREPYVIHVGTFEPRKRIDVIVDAWRLLRLKRPGCGLVLAGGRGWKSTGLRRQLRQEGIHYLEYVPDSHLPYLYAGAVAAVSASAYEGFGLPVLEAAACGTPVVLPDVPWARELGGAAAYYYEQGDPAALAAALGMMTAEGHACPVIDVKKYSWRAAAASYADLFRRPGAGA